MGSLEKGSFVLSIVSLGLAVPTAVYTWFGYFEKPDLRLVPPEQVTLYASYSGKWPYVTMVTDFNVFNDCRPGKYGLVMGESLEFTVEGRSRVLRWQQFGKWGEKGFEPSAPAQPFAVDGGNVAAQEVSFAPRSKPSDGLAPGETVGDNWVDWDTFVTALQKGNLRLRCVIECYDGSKSTSDIEIQVTPGVIEDLENPKKRWAAAACRKK